MQSVYLPKCINKQQASFICSTPECEQNAFLCPQMNCICKQNHLKCHSNNNLKEVVEKLFEKGKGTQKTMAKFAVLTKLYENLLAKVHQDQNEMKLKSPLLGLQQHQFEFDQIIHGQKSGQITGDITSTVLSSLTKMPFSIFQQITNDQSFIKKLESQFQECLLSLRTLWKFKVKHDSSLTINLQIQKIKQKQRELKEILNTKTYWLQVDGKQAQNCNLVNDLKAITGVGFNQCNKNILQLLGTHCKNLKTLGVKSEHQKFKNQQALEIAKSLKNLTHLHLYNHEIQDEGAIEIAKNLQDLAGLYLYGNKLTSDGQQQIGNLLPRCAQHISQPK